MYAVLTCSLPSQLVDALNRRAEAIGGPPRRVVEFALSEHLAPELDTDAAMEQRKAMEAMAEDLGISCGELIRRAVEAYQPAKSNGAKKNASPKPGD